jgi:hypothetical protein
LSGCYVTSRNLPASTGPAVDERLVGAWRALNEDGKPNPSAYLHFLNGADGQPLTFVFIDERNWSAYDLTSLQVGKRRMFAAKQRQAMKDKPEPNYILGFYEVKGDMLEFSLINPDTLKAAINAREIKGRIDAKQSDKVILAASPQELATYFANTDMKKLVMEQMSKAERIK